MGLVYDSVFNQIHSISEDKKYKVYDLTRDSVIQEITPTNQQLNCIWFDKENRRSFIADKQGNVLIYSITQTSLLLLNQINT